MGKCRWASQRVVILQIFPRFYLLIQENPRRWTHKAAAWWLRSRGEGGYLVPSLSGCAPFPEGCEGRPCWCSCLHASAATICPQPPWHPGLDRQFRLSVCLWHRVSSCGLELQRYFTNASHLWDSMGMEERNLLQLSTQDWTCTNQHHLHTALGTHASCPWWEQSLSLRVIASVRRPMLFLNYFFSFFFCGSIVSQAGGPAANAEFIGIHKCVFAQLASGPCSLVSAN